jgi:hypothetical protein
VSQEIVPSLVGTPFAVMNTIGLVAFALVGASKAIREEFDLLGITIVGVAMAFAGGAARGLLVTRVPLVVRSPIEISLGLVGVNLAVVLSLVLSAPDTHPVTVVADAIGLAAFATTGAIVAARVGVSAFGVVAIASIKTVGRGRPARSGPVRPLRGLLRDLCGSRGEYLLGCRRARCRCGHGSGCVCRGDGRNPAGRRHARLAAPDGPAVGATLPRRNERLRASGSHAR